MRSVASSTYERTYDDESRPSWQRFLASQGKHWSIESSYALSLCSVRDGMTVLEIGCGTGAVTFTCGRQRAVTAIGMDYSEAAVQIAGHTTRSLVDEDFRGRLLYLQADAACIPLANNSADVIFSCFVAEHLYPEQLDSMFQECYRVLRPGGRVVVETSPNMWRLKYGFRLTRLAYKVPVMARLYLDIMGMDNIPGEAKSEEEGLYHVNEQDIRSLGRSLKRAGFLAKTWIGPDRDPRFTLGYFCRRWGATRGKALWYCYFLLYRMWPIKLIFGDLVFGVGMKPVG